MKNGTIEFRIPGKITKRRKTIIMTFSQSIKEELSRISNLTNKECVKAELIGYLITNNVNIKNKKIKFATESQYNINRFSKLLSNVNINKYKIDIQGKIFYVEIDEKIDFEEIKLIDNKFIVTNKIEQFSNSDLVKKSIIRGCFLGSGSINNPNNTYHLEIIFNSKENMNYIEYLLKKYEINIKNMKTSLYLKEGEEISKLLACIGANKAVLRFEEIRVIRDMRNNVNRIVNCETANLNKTVNASLKQVENIKFIKKMNKFHELSESLQEIANLRLENPDVSLIELGKLLSNPIGKSGVNYRLKAINDFADELRKCN